MVCEDGMRLLLKDALGWFRWVLNDEDQTLNLTWEFSRYIKHQTTHSACHLTHHKQSHTQTPRATKKCARNDTAGLAAAFFCLVNNISCYVMLLVNELWLFLVRTRCAHSVFCSFVSSTKIFWERLLVIWRGALHCRRRCPHCGLINTLITQTSLLCVVDYGTHQPMMVKHWFLYPMYKCVVICATTSRIPGRAMPVYIVA